MDSKSADLRRLCIPTDARPSSLGATTLVEVVSPWGGGTLSSSEERSLVSPSLVPMLKKLIPRNKMDSHGDSVSFGGEWFWEGYRHALFGEDVLFDLQGTGASLSEDTLESQTKARLLWLNDLNSCLDKGADLCSAKLEILCAISLTIVMHVSKQPLLENDEGPQALVLCGTKDQCDEFTFVLNQLCSELHLVTHNLFEPYPSMPAGRRAEIVVGTAPLWENVARLGKGTSDRTGLEGILLQLYDDQPLSAPTYNSAKWRPYSLNHIEQLAVFDLDLQVSCGFTPVLLRILGYEFGSDGKPARVPSDLPPLCQLYGVLGGNQHVSGATILGQLLFAMHESRKRSSYGCAEVVLREKRHHTHTKRGRSNQSDDTTTIEAEATLPSGLLVRNALSFSRLCADSSAYEELSSGILQEARQFWCEFDSGVNQHCEQLAMPIKCNLVYICVEQAEKMLVQETCALIQVVDGECYNKAHESRYSLLFRHLEEKLNGELFDGSVISCTSIQHVQPWVQYRFLNATDTTHVALHEFFSTPVVGAIYLLMEKQSGNLENVSEEMKEAHARAFPKSKSSPRPTREAKEVVEVPRLGCLSRHLLPDQIGLNPFTVMVIRNVAATRNELCMSRKSPDLTWQEYSSKPLALFLLEECCQYGCVVSYYCFEQKLPPQDLSDGEGRELDLGDAADMNNTHQRATPSTTASLFIEFASLESAMEAVRLLNLRYQAGTSPADQITERKPRAHLFRNVLYYDGVHQEEQHVNQTHSDPFSEDDEFTEFSLLAE